MNVSNPAVPVHTGSLANGAGGALLDSPAGVFVSGKYAYVTSQNSNALEVVDVSNPAVPVHAGSLTNGTGGALLSNPWGIYVSGNYAYIASLYSDALEIVDLGLIPAIGVNVVSPTKITGSFDLTGVPAGQYNVVVTNPDGQQGILVNGFSVTAPSPLKIGIYNSGNWYMDYNGDGQFIPATVTNTYPMEQPAGHKLSVTGMETGRARSGSTRTVSGTSITAVVA